MPFSTGSGDSGANSRMQKWPDIDVIATAWAPAAASRRVRRAKTSACRSGAPVDMFWISSRASAFTMVRSMARPAAACARARCR